MKGLPNSIQMRCHRHWRSCFGARLPFCRRRGAQSLPPPLVPCRASFSAWQSEKRDPRRLTLWMAHAAVCGTGAARLRQSMRLLGEDPPAKKLRKLAILFLASGDWQLAVELARTPHRSVRGKTFGWPLWAGAALAASLMLAPASRCGGRVRILRSACWPRPIPTPAPSRCECPAPVLPK